MKTAAGLCKLLVSRLEDLEPMRALISVAVADNACPMSLLSPSSNSTVLSRTQQETVSGFPRERT
jgi:hypothetical protein